MLASMPAPLPPLMRVSVILTPPLLTLIPTSDCPSMTLLATTVSLGLMFTSITACPTHPVNLVPSTVSALPPYALTTAARVPLTLVN